MQAFYILTLDERVHKQWVLGALCSSEGNQINPFEFCRGKRYDPSVPLRISVLQKGTPTEWSFNNAMVPLVSKRVLALLLAHCASDFQAIPVSVPGHEDEFTVINVTTVRDCIDPQRRIPMGDWQERTRGAFDRYPVHIDVAAATGAGLLRAEKSLSAVIASENLKKVLESEGVFGVTFLQTY